MKKSERCLAEKCQLEPNLNRLVHRQEVPVKQLFPGVGVQGEAQEGVQEVRPWFLWEVDR